MLQQLFRKSKKDFRDPKLDILFDLHWLGLHIDASREIRQEISRIMGKIEELEITRKERS